MAKGKYITRLETTIQFFLLSLIWLNLQQFGYDALSQKNVIPYFWPNHWELVTRKRHLNHFSFQKRGQILRRIYIIFEKWND